MLLPALFDINNYFQIIKVCMQEKKKFVNIAVTILQVCTFYLPSIGVVSP